MTSASRIAPAPRGPATFLTAARRRRELAELADGPGVDVLVIGGGITGVGVALDAATRGLSVALIERRDLAFGTSRWSSKLAHGGLRYLAKGQFDVAWESARERDVLATVSAPHLIRALPQLTPVIGPGQVPVVATVELATRIGDVMRTLSGTSRRRLPSTRRIGSPEARLWAPALTDERLRGALLHWDAQLEDDARLVVAVARTAAAHGARILTHVEATTLTSGGAQALDTVSGESLTIRARHVINATGVWAAGLVEGIALRPSRGSHLLIPAARLGHPRAMLNVPLPGHFARFVFAIPRSDGLVLVGLTDEPVPEPIPDVPDVPAEDETFLLQTLSRALSVPVGPQDVVGRFAGLRPLLAAGGSTADISRRHAVLESPDGIVTVVGGKLTTFRQMAEDAVDIVARRPGVVAAPCRTTRLRLVGAPSPGDPLTADRAPARLVRRYGTEATEILALADGRPELVEALGGGALGVELLAAVQREGALTVDDVLDRRLRLGLVAEWRRGAEGLATEVLDGTAALSA